MGSNYSDEELEQIHKRAVEGNAEAQELWGNALYYGDCVEENREEAIRWYERAAEQGRPLSQGKLGWSNLMGLDGVETDVKKGLSLLQSAVEGGDAAAHASMALAYIQGTGIDSDPERAATMARKAVELNKRPRHYVALAEALMARDGIDVDTSEVADICRKVLANDEIEPVIEMWAEERLEMMEKLNAANELKNTVMDDISDLQVPFDEEDGEEISRVLADAVEAIFERETENEISPSTFIHRFLQTFTDMQNAWYNSYADGDGNVLIERVSHLNKMGLGDRPILVEGDDTPFLVLGKDGKVLRLHPSYDFEDESIGDITEPLVASLVKVGDEISTVGYIPGVDGYVYPARDTNGGLEIESDFLDALDEGVGSISVDESAIYKMGKTLYQWAYRLQMAMRDEGISIENHSDELSEIFEPIRVQLLTLKAELTEAEAAFDHEEDEPEAEPITEFSDFQREAVNFMEELYPVLRDLVADPHQNIGQFPFFVQHGQQEILLVLHENGAIDSLKEGYELPEGSFSQDVDGLVTVQAPEPLCGLRFIQVLPETQWETVETHQVSMA